MSDKRALTDTELDAVLARLPEIRERHDATTEGEWIHGRLDLVSYLGDGRPVHYIYPPNDSPEGNDRVPFLGPDCRANAVFSAHAFRDIPDLLAAVETLREQRDALARNMKTLEDAYYQQVRELAELRAKQEPSDA